MLTARITYATDEEVKKEIRSGFCDVTEAISWVQVFTDVICGKVLEVHIYNDI